MVLLRNSVRFSAGMTLSGDRDFMLLAAVLPKEAKKVMKQAINAGATPIVKAAKRAAPKESGTLKKSIGKRLKSYPSGNVVAVIGAKRNVSGEYRGKRRVPTFYLHLVTGGSKPHSLRDGYSSKKPKANLGGRDYGWHTGANANPFLEKAFKASLPAAVEAAAEKLRQGISKVVAKRT